MKPSGYHGIALWDKQLGRSKRDTQKEQAHAAETRAPIDAIYSDAGNNWVCVSDLTEGHPFRAEYAAYLADQNGEPPPVPPPVPVSKLSTLRMAAGNEKKYSRVIMKDSVMFWVGIGWINERPAQPADFEVYPVVID